QGARFRVRPPVEENVKDDIGIEEDSPHRYFAARCFLYSSMSALLRIPRTERRIGAAPVAAEGGPATAPRYASTIFDTETPRRFAYCLARKTTRSSTLN